MTAPNCMELILNDHFCKILKTKKHNEITDYSDQPSIDPMIKHSVSRNEVGRFPFNFRNRRSLYGSIEITKQFWSPSLIQGSIHSAGAWLAVYLGHVPADLGSDLV